MSKIYVLNCTVKYDINRQFSTVIDEREQQSVNARPGVCIPWGSRVGYVSDIAERAKKSHRKEGKGESSASAAERECCLPGRCFCGRV